MKLGCRVREPPCTFDDAGGYDPVPNDTKHAASREEVQSSRGREAATSGLMRCVARLLSCCDPVDKPANDRAARVPADVPVEICKVCVRPGDKHDADSQSISSALTPDSFAASRSDSSEPFEQDLSGFGDEPSVAAPADPSPYQEVPGGTGRYQEKPPPRRSGWEHWPRFDRVADFDVVPGSAWRVQRSVEYGGRLFWTHAPTRVDKAAAAATEPWETCS